MGCTFTYNSLSDNKKAIDVPAELIPGLEEAQRKISAYDDFMEERVDIFGEFKPITGPKYSEYQTAGVKDNY